MLTPLLTRLAGPSFHEKIPIRVGMRQTVTLKRARERVSADDGMRVLVDRLWPRGVPREDLIIDLWLREIAPSAGLRNWYAHDLRRKDEFALRYRAELAGHDDLLHLLDDLRRRGRLTLLCDAKELALSHGTVLRDVLIEGRFLRHHLEGKRP
ncbi:DUF488 domain-containing protein [Variovorax ginsengisoli]|uniref:DUF488 family protein n=1 Tax=Variovorax ginsengisoli TaxID=363844 RepID=A0ABT8SCT1_9BURK|nr:DUF488 family protein [Variovorax ginsengisoli]MDN8617478.1 DUF488 family protein [Variovorax ginsengisoli]MDO1536648.1 DUF488 family protein [Variovorax ginsengisoli]